MMTSPAWVQGTTRNPSHPDSSPSGYFLSSVQQWQPLSHNALRGLNYASRLRKVERGGSEDQVSFCRHRLGESKFAVG
jgi:hypothetical protein